MLRITAITNVSPAVFKLECRIVGNMVEELRRVCQESLADPSHTGLVLDLTDVSFLDRDGIALIRHLRGRNVVLTKSSPFVAELLKEVLSCS
jgi:anti-anti-sigma regulatory factor